MKGVTYSEEFREISIESAAPLGSMELYREFQSQQTAAISEQAQNKSETYEHIVDSAAFSS